MFDVIGWRGFIGLVRIDEYVSGKQLKSHFPITR